ncbi:MAG: NFACT family protein, partial [Clostridiales bacterium]
DITDLTEESFCQTLLEQDLSLPTAKALTAAISGLSPFGAKEVVRKAGLAPEDTLEFLGQSHYQALWQGLAELGEAKQKGSWQPVLLHLGEKPYDYYALPLQGVPPEEQTFYPTMSQTLDCFYSVTEANHTLENRQRDLVKAIHTEVARLEKKIALQQEDLAKAEAADAYRLGGELLTTYLGQIEKGMAQISLPSFEDPTKFVDLKLDPTLSPMD